jgi:hypothetical protein
MDASTFSIVPHSPVFFPDPGLIPGQWAQCQEELQQTFASRTLERLTPTIFKSVCATIRKFLPEMVDNLYQSGGATQLLGFGSSSDDKNAIFIKVRLSETGIETLVSRVLGVGSNKVVKGVVRCSGGCLAERRHGRIYAYAKCPDLSGYRKDLHDVAEAERRGTSTAKDQRKAEQAKEEIPKIERLLRTEVEMASSVPTAVRTWVVWRRHNLTKIKGIGMEYIDGGDLFAFLSHTPPPSPCSDDLVLLASRVCFAVAQAHEIGILHGDVKSPNVLLKKTPEGSIIPLLCDFGVARRLPSRNRCVERESTYAAPETLLASAENPVEYSISMDSWSLGLTVLDIVYGVRATQKVFDSKSGASIPGESVVKVLRDLPLKRPEVDEVILNLMQFNPADRWTAMQAAEALLAALR